MALGSVAKGTEAMVISLRLLVITKTFTAVTIVVVVLSYKLQL